MTEHAGPFGTKSPETSGYVRHLENEMTIMGILSTFCVVAIGGCITILSGFSKDSSERLAAFWYEHGPFVTLGLISILLAAFFFYRERSLLSHYVGQIYLSQYDSQLADFPTMELHKRADNWITWRFYRLAFLCLFTAAAFFGRVALVLNSTGSFTSLLEKARTLEIVIPIAFCFLSCVFVCMAFAAFPEAAHPYQESFRNPRKFFGSINFFFRGGLE